MHLLLILIKPAVCRENNEKCRNEKGGRIVVTSFMFLGSEVEKDGRPDNEIRRRLAIGKATMIELEKL